MILYKNDFFTIEENQSDVFLRALKPGCSLQEFNQIVDELARVKLTTFQAIQVALRDVTGQLVHIGKLKEIIELSISADHMYVYVHINLEKDNYRTSNEIRFMVESMLKVNNIVYGLKDELLDNLPKNTKVLIAEGLLPYHGKDAEVTYYELSYSKPRVNQVGKINHYDQDLIDNVLVDEWLGRKIPATRGVNGQSVKGETIYAKMGRDLKLKYESKSVKVIKDDQEVERLYSKINGAVKIQNNKILVDNHLVIQGDVDYNTGHIDFDGYVTIKGTVQDKFNVTATYDISIDAPMGIGAVDFIESKKGSVLIKGGINGKGIARIIAAKDVITKYSNEANIIAGHNIHVGLYVMDSELKAKKIMLPPKVGRIIGGKTFATHRIETGSIGNKFEKPTRVYVEGFERDSILEMLTFYNNKNTDMTQVLNKMRKELVMFEKNIGKLDERAVNTYDYLLLKYEKQCDEMEELSGEVDRLTDVLRTRGEGEIAISDSVFPKTLLEIKNLQRKIQDQMTGSFYVKDRTFYHNN